MYPPYRFVRPMTWQQFRYRYGPLIGTRFEFEELRQRYEDYLRQHHEEQRRLRDQYEELMRYRYNRWVYTGRR